jgi:MoaA/NifB/PqqE/SkfB family radical SAM enzyme
MSDRDINIRSILTNGTLVNGENAEAIVAAGVDLVQVSIDGDEQTHDNVRGVKGSFLKALRGIKRIQSAANSNNCSKPEIRLNCVISSENIHCLDSLVDLAEESRTQLQFQHLMWMTLKILILVCWKTNWPL